MAAWVIERSPVAFPVFLGSRAFDIAFGAVELLLFSFGSVFFGQAKKMNSVAESERKLLIFICNTAGAPARRRYMGRSGQLPLLNFLQRHIPHQPETDIVVPMIGIDEVVLA